MMRMTKAIGSTGHILELGISTHPGVSLSESPKDLPVLGIINIPVTVTNLDESILFDINDEEPRTPTPH